MTAGATTPVPHPGHPLNRLRSAAFVRPGLTSSERRAFLRAVRLASATEVSRQADGRKPYRWSHRNGQGNTRKMPESKGLLPCAKSFECEILENPNEIHYFVGSTGGLSRCVTLLARFRASAAAFCRAIAWASSAKNLSTIRSSSPVATSLPARSKSRPSRAAPMRNMTRCVIDAMTVSLGSLIPSFQRRS